MYLNLLTIFICINFAVGMVTGVEGSPLYVEVEDNDCNIYPITGADVDDTDGDGDVTEIIRIAPAVDPIEGRNILGLSNMTEATQGLTNPTNSTDVNGGTGDGSIFDPITEAADAAKKGLYLMTKVVTGGYILDIVEHTTLNCQLDNRAMLTTQSMENGDGESCAEQSLSVPCLNSTYGTWIDPTEDGVNPMWDNFEGGIQVIFSLLLAITLMYWITGRGHLLSS
jgi:hypothetical protein|tara:strand:- start:97 stop:771 length:675 start_codon:yes stop_codon:yes gene_type:complete